MREICVATKRSKKMGYCIRDDLGEYAETKNKFQQLNFFFHGHTAIEKWWGGSGPIQENCRGLGIIRLSLSCTFNKLPYQRKSGIDHLYPGVEGM